MTVLICQLLLRALLLCATAMCKCAARRPILFPQNLAQIEAQLQAGAGAPQLQAQPPVNLQHLPTKFRQAQAQPLFSHLPACPDVYQRIVSVSAACGPSRAQSASRSVRRALLTPQVHPGSLYGRGRSS